jgi:hypothetical protein
LSDVALYEGATATAMERGAELVHLGHELSDRHCIAVGTVNAALARAYAGDPQGALRLVDAVDIPDLGPTDAAWLAYARGEALSEANDAAAPAALLEAIQLGNSVDNHFVVVVGHDSLATAYARLGDLDLALDAFVAALHRYRRHGNYTHAIQALYKLAALFESVGDDEGAVVVIGACTAARRHVPFATEPETITAMTDAVRRRVGAERFDEWFATGRALEIDVALPIAAERAEQNRH